MRLGTLIALCGGAVFGITTLYHDAEWSTHVGQATIALAYAILAASAGAEIALTYSGPLPTVAILSAAALFGCVFYVVLFHGDIPADDRIPMLLTLVGTTPLTYLTALTTEMGDMVSLVAFSVAFAVALIGPVTVGISAYDAWATAEPPTGVAS